jgi:pyridinium-3,5-bisthiocarboxylic acid mononucleotide nickel chelatase
MGKAVYFDMFAGCSGDMVLGSLLDAGLDLEDLATGLSALPVTGYRIVQEKVKRSAITATRANVIMDKHIHQHDRAYHDIVDLIKGSRLPSRIKNRSLLIFRNLGEAEAKVHGVPLEKVHFHEVGAVDSIVDIVGAVIGFDILSVTDFYASAFPVSTGHVNTRHGVLPLPAPATTAVMAQAKAPIVDAPLPTMQGFELVTPTGAAIVCSLAKFERPPMNIEKTGYGAGGRDSQDYPNILRLWIGEAAGQASAGGMVLLETNIDDMNPQVYDYVMEKLFASGALDVWLTPIQMKKNRPAVTLSVLSPAECEQALVEILMRETTTLGIRIRPVFRHIAGRQLMEIKSTYGKVRIKVKQFKGEVLAVAPEYDDCRRIADRKNIPLREVYRIIEAEAREQLARLRADAR